MLWYIICVKQMLVDLKKKRQRVLHKSNEAVSTVVAEVNSASSHPAPCYNNSSSVPCRTDVQTGAGLEDAGAVYFIPGNNRWPRWLCLVSVNL